ncbi:MAG TPA: DUF3089 domain-containing protein [Sphingomicrobium sp.]
MCARRFLAIVFLLTLLAVAAAFAIFQWGGSVLIGQATPKGHFEEPAAGEGPDYISRSSWLARPDIAENPAQWLPPGVSNPPAPGNAAVFYIHPTTYLERDRWNAPIAAGGATELRTRPIVRSQASAFSAAGAVWAPRYRQAAYGAFLLASPDATQALDLAYRDVAAAFDRFMAEAGDRPIILAGHSQGALHLLRLLRERRDEVQGRLVAAYVVGWPVSTTADLPALVLPACRSPGQTGCILAWLTFGEPANPDLILNEWKTGRGPSGRPHRAQDLLCVNPLTGTQGGTASAAENPGTLVPSPDLRSATLSTGLVGARCHGGLLLLDASIPSLGPLVLPGNNYHVYDISLFWGAIREDTVQRLEAWQAR